MQEDVTSERPVHDRRRHPRYRWTAPISIASPDGAALRGLTIEMSESGLSAAISAPLKVGDQVTIDSIGSAKAVAVVRRITGRVFGFEFSGLSQEQKEWIVEKCRTLPPYLGDSLNI
jgi:hypothetical protein